MCATAKAAGEKFSGEPSAREGGRPVGAGSVTQALDQTLAMSRARPPGSAVGARASTHPVGPLCPRRRTYSSSILMLTGFRRKKSTPRHKSWPWGRGLKESADNNVRHDRKFFCCCKLESCSPQSLCVLPQIQRRYAKLHRTGHGVASSVCQIRP